MWQRLKSMSGFGWDKELGIPTAPDDVWVEEIRKQAQLREFRTMPLANSDELTEIFDGVRASGNHALSLGP